MASTVEPIPFKGGVESLGDIATTIGDNSREVHMQLEQMALLYASLATTVHTQQDNS